MPDCSFEDELMNCRGEVLSSCSI